MAWPIVSLDKPLAAKLPRGRPKGSLGKLSRQMRAEAAATGKLPHEILLSIARGEEQFELRITADGKSERFPVGVPLPMRMSAAQSAAPYYAPKISSVEVIQGVSDDDLDAIIADAAAKAGLSIGADGEGEEEEGA